MSIGSSLYDDEGAKIVPDILAKADSERLSMSSKEKIVLRKYLESTELSKFGTLVYTGGLKLICSSLSSHG